MLTGLQHRSGLVVDAVGVACRPVLSDGTLGPESTVGNLAGGTGGTLRVSSCPAGSVITGAHIRYGSLVDGVVAICKNWIPATRRFGTTTTGYVSAGSPGNIANLVQEHCESRAQPGKGVRGRAGGYVDAIGFTCDEP